MAPQAPTEPPPVSSMALDTPTYNVTTPSYLDEAVSRKTIAGIVIAFALFAFVIIAILAVSRSKDRGQARGGRGRGRWGGAVFKRPSYRHSHVQQPSAYSPRLPHINSRYSGHTMSQARASTHPSLPPPYIRYSLHDYGHDDYHDHLPSANRRPSVDSFNSMNTATTLHVLNDVVPQMHQKPNDTGGERLGLRSRSRSPQPHAISLRHQTIQTPQPAYYTGLLAEPRDLRATPLYSL